MKQISSCYILALLNADHRKKVLSGKFGNYFRISMAISSEKRLTRINASRITGDLLFLWRVLLGRTFYRQFNVISEIIEAIILLFVMFKCCNLYLFLHTNPVSSHYF